MMVDGSNMSVLGPGDSAGEMAAMCGNLTEDYQVELETKVHSKVRNHGEAPTRDFSFSIASHSLRFKLYYQRTWGSYEYWCEGVLFSSLGLFGD